MELYTSHGRTSPDEQLDDWGPSGPRLMGVAGVHQTYDEAVNVHFKTAEAAEEAHRLTGWPWFDDKALSMRRHHEFVLVAPPYDAPMYFGDWGLI